MTLGRYAESIVLSGIVIVSLGVAAVSLRRRSLPTWSGAPARLVEVIIAISLVVVASQTLGTIGLFRVGPLVTTLVLVALLTFWIGKIGAGGTKSLTAVAGPSPVDSRTRQEAGWEPVAAIVAVSLVAAEWSAGTLHALRDGVSQIDSLWYHMPTQRRVRAKRLRCLSAQRQQRQCDRVLSGHVGVVAHGWHPPLRKRFLVAARQRVVAWPRPVRRLVPWSPVRRWVARRQWPRL